MEEGEGVACWVLLLAAAAAAAAAALDWKNNKRSSLFTGFTNASCIIIQLLSIQGRQFINASRGKPFDNPQTSTHSI